MPAPPNGTVAASSSFGVASLQSLGLSMQGIASAGSLTHPHSSDLIKVAPVVVRPLSLTTLTVRSVGPVLTPPCAGIFLFYPVRAPGSHTFSGGANSVFSSTRRGVTVLSVVLFSIDGCGCLRFLGGNGGFYYVFTGQGLFRTGGRYRAVLSPYLASYTLFALPVDLV